MPMASFNEMSSANLSNALEIVKKHLDSQPEQEEEKTIFEESAQ